MLEVKNLSINFYDTTPVTKGIENINISICEGETVGIVGESGSGKTLTALSIMGLIEDHVKIDSGEILFNNKNLLQISAKERRKIIGNDISMIFQEPISSLNPLMKVGKQVEESLKLHKNMTKDDRKKEAIKMLELVKLPDANIIYDKYPHELSGGMCQRVMIAAAMICHPKLLIADEPTTALDVTIQKNILKLISEFHETENMGVMFISHDLRVIRYICDKVIVLYKGKVVESGTVEDVFNNPKEEYTKKLVGIKNGKRK